MNKDNLTISQLIHSPYWSPEQIESKELKNSLIDFTVNGNFTINLDKLYEEDLRYKLVWSTWNLLINKN